MRKVILLNLVTWILLLNNSYAQECLHTNLSHQFDYKISVTKSLAKGSELYDKKVVLSIYDKKSKKLIQKINAVDSKELYDAFKSHKTVRSYITGYNENKTPSDYDYGDFIVVDLNFDGKEDFVINGGYSADAGPNYIFYMQDDKGHFKLNHFLTDRMASFPTYMDSKRKTLVQIYVMGGYQGKKIFKYNTQTKKWRIAKWTEKKLY